MFLDCFETTLKLLGCLLGMPKISDVFGKEDISGKGRFLDKSFVKRIWIILRLGNWSIPEHEGPCSEAKTSQFLRSLKCFWHALLMLSIVTSSYLNETKSLGPYRKYFMVVGFGFGLSLCTNSSLILTRYIKNPNKVYQNSQPPAFSPFMLFHMNTSGVKIRPTLKN